MQKFSDERKGGSDRKGKGALAGTSVSAAPTPAAAQAFKLRAVIRGIHWEAGKQLLDLLELALANDRQYEIARKQAMDIIAGSNRQEDAAINAIMFARPAAEAQEKES